MLWVLPLLLGAAPAVAAPAGFTGYFKIPQPGEHGALVLAVSSCGLDRYCGRLVDLGTLPAKDTRNPSPAAQERALCGLDVLSVTDEGGNAPMAHMMRGTFYDPRTGDDTTVALWMGPEGMVHVSSHAGRAIMSRSYVRPEVWEPVDGPQHACDAARPVS